MTDRTEQCSSVEARRRARREMAATLARAGALQHRDITTTKLCVFLATVCGQAIAILIGAAVTA